MKYLNNHKLEVEYYEKDGRVYIPFTLAELGVSEREAKAMMSTGEFDYEDVWLFADEKEFLLDEYWSDLPSEEQEKLEKQWGSADEYLYGKNDNAKKIFTENYQYFHDTWFNTARMEALGDIEEYFESGCAIMKLNLLKEGKVPAEWVDDYVLDHYSELRDGDYADDTNLDQSDIESAMRTMPAFAHPRLGPAKGDYFHYDSYYEDLLSWRPEKVGEEIPEDTYRARMSLLEPEDVAALEKVFAAKDTGEQAKYDFFGGPNAKEITKGQQRESMKKIPAWTDTPESAVRIYNASAAADKRGLYDTDTLGKKMAAQDDELTEKFMKEAFAYKYKQKQTATQGMATKNVERDNTK